MSKSSKYKVNVGKKAKIVVEWSDDPINYSHESKKNIISVFADKYRIPINSVKVTFKPTRINENGERVDISTDVITNIQDPKFQIKLFADYISENRIDGVDFEYIKKIDSEINSKIDYDVYDKFKKYEIDWIEWENFLSYGPNNRFDFKDLNGLVLINSIPANQGGKTNFVIDIPSFLLFGKTQKPYTLSECFNKFLDTTTFSVSGGITIDGLQYVIERNVTRARKRTGEWGDASQKVKYYQVINGEREDLPDETENKQGEHSIKTNKIIKEAIGSEKDFNMIVSATGNDLDSLIDVGNTERGKLLSKWIGLFPLEEKDKIAKEKYKEFEKTLKSKLYDKTSLLNEVISATDLIQKNDAAVIFLNERVVELDESITAESLQKDNLLSLRKEIDQNILRLDINTINLKLDRIKTDGANKRAELTNHNKEYELVKDVAFDEEVYKDKIKIDKELSIGISEIKNKILNLNTTNKNLTDSESCPTCHRKYEGADNSIIVKSNIEKIDELTKANVENNLKLNANKILIAKLESDRELYNKKVKLDSLINIVPIQIKNLLSDYRENEQKIKDYNLNKDAIDQNNKIDINLLNINAKIKSFSTERDLKLKEAENANRNIIDCNKKIKSNNLIVSEIDAEFILIKNWKIYLEMVGKNGISKAVLKKTLPIINSELYRLLEDVCDFDVEVNLTDKNDVIFKIIKDEISSDLAGGSGFERTAAALALRCVLGNISTMPRPNFITLDEILGKVAKENYDSIKNIYAKVQDNYQFILHISHLDDIKDWHPNVITIKKVNNVSKVLMPLKGISTNNINN